jgi:hypothetical protein
MKPAENTRFDRLYQRHLRALKLQGTLRYFQERRLLRD